MPTKEIKKPQPFDKQMIAELKSGPDGTRTRDPLRDRQVF